jgi:hypothetical protein
VWELQFDGKGVESGTGGISELKFVGEFIELEALDDFSVDIEITGLFGSLGKGDGSSTVNIGFGEMSSSPFLEG